MPLVAGLSFELIKFAGRNRGRGWVQPIIWPGMQLQKLTTREPEDEQVVVAIAALRLSSRWRMRERLRTQTASVVAA